MQNTKSLEEGSAKGIQSSLGFFSYNNFSQPCRAGLKFLPDFADIGELNRRRCHESPRVYTLGP